MPCIGARHPRCSCSSTTYDYCPLLHSSTPSWGDHLKRQHNIQGTLQSHDNENNSAVYYYTITGHDNRIKLLYIQHPFPPMTYLIPGDIPWRQLRPIPHSGSSYKTPMGYPSWGHIIHKGDEERKKNIANQWKDSVNVVISDGQEAMWKCLQWFHETLLLTLVTSHFWYYHGNFNPWLEISLSYSQNNTCIVVLDGDKVGIWMFSIDFGPVKEMKLFTWMPWVMCYSFDCQIMDGFGVWTELCTLMHNYTNIWPGVIG